MIRADPLLSMVALSTLSITFACVKTPSAEQSQVQPEAEGPAYELRLDERPCPFAIPAGRSAECLTASFPVDRNQLGLGVVELPVAVIHPSGPATRPPVVYLHGGPGGRAFARAQRWFDQVLSEDGDIIVFDQRGSGDSLPSLDCPEAEGAWFQVFASALSPAQELAMIGAALEQCRTRLALEIDLNAFNTQANADDVEDLRRALGHASWSLYGVSYGTRLALEVMRRHPEGVRSVVLDSAYPPEVGGVEWMLDISQTGLERLIAGCLAQPGCGGSFPELATKLEQAMAGLDEQPYLLTLSDSQGVAHELSLTGADFYAGMYNALYDAELIPLVPVMIVSAAGGNYSFLPELAKRSVPRLTGGSEGARLSIDCADGGPLIDDAQLAGVIADHPTLATLFSAHALPFCAQWDVESAPLAFTQAVVSDIPTLILAGEFDPVTPVAQSELTRDALGDAALFVFPGQGHGPSSREGCAAQMSAAFLRDAAVDSSCWAALPQAKF